MIWNQWSPRCRITQQSQHTTYKAIHLVLALALSLKCTRRFQTFCETVTQTYPTEMCKCFARPKQKKISWRSLINFPIFLFHITLSLLVTRLKDEPTGKIMPLKDSPSLTRQQQSR